MNGARRYVVTGVVQGVGFRPFVARLAATYDLRGWAMNTPRGLEIQIEGPVPALDAFAQSLVAAPPPAARIDSCDGRDVVSSNSHAFQLLGSQRSGAPVAGMAPDLPICDECFAELQDPQGRRFGYPYITCAQCGPRYSIVRKLPYDREHTAMAEWPMCEACAAEYRDAGDRRFHAELTACPDCGPRYTLRDARSGQEIGGPPIARAAGLLRSGALVAIKGVGGYHLCCDAANGVAVDELRRRKFRKAKPFALMVRDAAVARTLIELSADAETLLAGPARPIVLAPARVSLPGVATDHHELGVMLPYAPLHHLLFAAGAPDVLVMTSANVSSEPVAFEDEDAWQRLSGIADAFLIGTRPIVRRVDDSIARSTDGGPVILRRGRGYAPGIVARLPSPRPILAVGADLKNTVTLVVDGAAINSQHIGDLTHLAAFDAFRRTIDDLLSIYALQWQDVLVAHDAHPDYASTLHALQVPAAGWEAVQHHRAHVASVLAERNALSQQVVGVAFDGAGYGDDGTVWGGEFFVGSVSSGLQRVASLRPFALPGGDAAALHPLSAAAGALSEITDLPDLTAAPFGFSRRYTQARALAHSGVRTFRTTSAGRLFDTAAALAGFSGENEYEGQAAIWLEQRAAGLPPGEPLAYSVSADRLDFTEAFRALILARQQGMRDVQLSRAFHDTIAAGTAEMITRLCEQHHADTVVLSGGVFQNQVLVQSLLLRLTERHVWMNRDVPANDGGISLGQAAVIAASCGLD